MLLEMQRQRCKTFRNIKLKKIKKTPKYHNNLPVTNPKDVKIMEYYSVTRKEDVLSFETLQVDFERILLSEIRQTEEIKYHVISLIAGI